MKRQPVREQVVKWCVCGEWFASERDQREHKCSGPTSRYTHDRISTYIPKQSEIWWSYPDEEKGK